MTWTLEAIKEFLDEQLIKYNNRHFIEWDPISIPHQYTKKEDIEIAGLIAATLAWGNRKSIIHNSTDFLRRMDNAPSDFIKHSTIKDLKIFDGFVHRTFNKDDAKFFVKGLQHIYKTHPSLESCFKLLPGEELAMGISRFRQAMLSVPHLKRSEKHISDPLRGSASKRLCMYLRWMVRTDKAKVDLGIWKQISPSQLCIPLDVHTGRNSRELGILTRKQDDWKAVIELTNHLKLFDSKDPIKYDIALFGMGVGLKS